MPSKILKPNLYVHLSTKWSQEGHGEVPPCGICRKSCFPTQWWQVFAFWICSKSRLLEFIISESKISWNVTQKVPGAQPEWWNANRVRFFLSGSMTNGSLDLTVPNVAEFDSRHTRIYITKVVFESPIFIKSHWIQTIWVWYRLKSAEFQTLLPPLSISGPVPSRYWKTILRFR